MPAAVIKVLVINSCGGLRVRLRSLRTLPTSDISLLITMYCFVRRCDHETLSFFKGEGPDLLTLGVHSTKVCHELSLVKMLVHGSTILCYPPSNLCHITFRWQYDGSGYISSLHWEGCWEPLEGPGLKRICLKS